MAECCWVLGQLKVAARQVEALQRCHACQNLQAAPPAPCQDTIHWLRLLPRVLYLQQQCIRHHWSGVVQQWVFYQEQLTEDKPAAGPYCASCQHCQSCLSGPCTAIGCSMHCAVSATNQCSSCCMPVLTSCQTCKVSAVAESGGGLLGKGPRT